MFEKFREYVKSELKVQQMTYAQLAEKTGIAESTLKCFMSGHHESRNIAEKISDVLNLKLIYSNHEYTFQLNKYLNPIPYIDMAKEFEFRIRLVSDEVIETKEAKRKAAEFIKNMTVDEICEWLSCKSFPVYLEE